MLGKRKRILLAQKARAFDNLIDELENVEIRVFLNGMPYLIIDIYHALMLLHFNNAKELEICKTHGNARVDARMVYKDGFIRENFYSEEIKETTRASQPIH